MEVAPLLSANNSWVLCLVAYPDSPSARRSLPVAGSRTRKAPARLNHQHVRKSPARSEVIRTPIQAAIRSLEREP
jgi:hypothetical protein